MKKRAALVLSFLVGAMACSGIASAQPRRPTPNLPAPAPPPPAVQPAVPGNLRAHVGVDYAMHLLRSTDPDERIRGIQRAAAIGSAETVALLEQATESSPAVRSDPRALIELARALARFGDQERARTALLLIVNTGNPGLAGRLPTPSRVGSGDPLALEDGDPVARAELARETAAIALARSGADRALEQLYGVARSGGSGQNAAILALQIAPPRDPGFYGTTGASLPPAVIRMLGRLGDLRALEILTAAAHSLDVTVRGAALVALGELGDERAIALSRAAIAESDARLRAAAGEAFVLLTAPERFKAVAALISDEATAAIGIHLAERVYDADITKLLAARAIDHPDRDLRAACIRALGRSPLPAAANALAAPQLIHDPQLGYFAAVELARSPAPNAMSWVLTLATNKETSALGVRAYVLRVLERGETAPAGTEILERLASSKDGRERALGVFGRLALGRGDLEAALGDPDARVRRAAAMASLAHPGERTARALLAHAAREKDEATRQLLMGGLAEGDAGRDPGAVVTTTSLIDRAESGGADAALSAYALARRADDANERKVGQLLAAKDPVLRAHTARGLAYATLADASGRLAAAYAYETDEMVRRAIVAALAARTEDATSPSRRGTLETAALLDPDGATRQGARLALAGAAAPFGAPITTETAWLRLVKNSGAPPDSAFVGAVIRADGVAVPIAFDEDGYALVPGLPPGDVRLVLAPRLPTYKSSPP